MMKLIEFQTTREYEYNGYPLNLRIISPSKQSGGWPGNDTTIREWTHSPHFVSKTLDKTTIIEVEKELGEINLDNWYFFEHGTLGLVLKERG